MKNIGKALKIGIPLGLAVYLMYITFEDPTKRTELFDAIDGMNLFWIFLSIVCAWVSHLVRARRWEYILEPMGYKTRLWTRYHATMAGYLINMILPRVGEVSRAALVTKYERVPFDKTFGTIAAERIIDVIMLGSITIVTMWTQRDVIWDHVAAMLNKDESVEASPYGFYIKIAIAVIFVVVFFFLGQKLKDKVISFLKGIAEGLMSIYKTPFKTRFIIDSLIIWALYLLMFYLPFFSMPESAALPLGALCAGFVFGSFSVVLTPGGTGTYHFAVGLALSLYGFDLGLGQALGMAIWASQALMLILFGALSLLLVPIYNRDYGGYTPISVQKTSL